MQTDPRGAERRSPTAFGENIGYDVANNAPPRPPRPPRTPEQPDVFYPPADIYGITRYMRQRSATGLCVVCGKPAPMAGATCKTPGCVRAWVFGGR